MRINSIIKNQQLIFLISIILSGFFALWVMGDLSSPILLSIVLAFLFRPVLVYLTQIGIPRKISVLITFLLAILAGMLFFGLFVPMLINEVQRYQQELPSLQFLLAPLEDFLANLNAPIESIESAQSVFSDVAGFLSETLSFGLSRVQDTANFFIGNKLVPIILFYWLWETETLSSGILRLVQKKRKKNISIYKLKNSKREQYY